MEYKHTQNEKAYIKNWISKSINQTKPHTKGGYLATPEPYKQEISTVLSKGPSGFVRFFNTTYNVGLTLGDWKYHTYGVDRSTAAFADIRNEVHLRAAHRLFHVCKEHGGVYTKLGQYIATMNHILPKEYIDILSPLTDRAKEMSADDARRVLETELGDRISEIAEFDPVPIAAASLAQVHVGQLKDGSKVAIKLQYTNLEAQVKSDLVCLRVMTRLLKRAFPEHDYEWMFPEFEQTAEEELDFLQEASNAKRASKMFKHNPEVCIPFVHSDLTTRRCLVMEFIDGERIDRVEAFNSRWGIQSKDVARIVLQAFNDMLFVHGLVHCDPHAGNVLVRQLPGGSRSQTQV